MTEWLVAFDDGPIEAETAKLAVERAAQDRSYEIGHVVFVVPVDADSVERFRIGAEKVSA